jgi:4-hydroxy-4-methyl-2-oxoglutarate aldolase
MTRLVSPDTFKALAALDTCSVTNAIECFDVRLRNEGFTNASIQCRLPALPPMLGYAITLRVRSSSPSWKGVNYLDRTDWWPHLTAQPGPHVLVIQDMDRHPGTGAFIGEVHAAILKALGTVGAITNGAARDLPAIERLGFRMFSSSVAVSHAYAHIVEIGGWVEVAGLRIASGDLLHGDQHGVVQIPVEVADKIPATVARIRERERHIVEYCQSAGFTMEGLKKIADGDPCPSDNRPDTTGQANRPA